MIPLHNFSEKSNRYPTRDHDRDWDYLRIMARSRHENLDKTRPIAVTLEDRGCRNSAAPMALRFDQTRPHVAKRRFFSLSLSYEFLVRGDHKLRSPLSGLVKQPGVSQDVLSRGMPFNLALRPYRDLSQSAACVPVCLSVSFKIHSLCSHLFTYDST